MIAANESYFLVFCFVFLPESATPKSRRAVSNPVFFAGACFCCRWSSCAISIDVIITMIFVFNIKIVKSCATFWGKLLNGSVYWSKWRTRIHELRFRDSIDIYLSKSRNRINEWDWRLSFGDKQNQMNGGNHEVAEGSLKWSLFRRVCAVEKSGATAFLNTFFAE